MNLLNFQLQKMPTELSQNLKEITHLIGIILSKASSTIILLLQKPPSKKRNSILLREKWCLLSYLHENLRYYISYLYKRYDIVIPYIIQCGFIYCLPYYQRHKLQIELNQKCSLCEELAILSELKSVKISNIKQKMLEIEYLNQNQVFQNETQLYVNGKKSFIQMRTLISNESYVMRIFEKENQQHQKQVIPIFVKLKFRSQFNFFLKNKISYQIKNLNLQSEIAFQLSPSKNEIIFQDSDGILGFFHPLCLKYMNLQYGNDYILNRFNHYCYKRINLCRRIRKQLDINFFLYIQLHTEIYFNEKYLKHILNKENMKDYQ
ncbi:unnamed protein product [Paramecium sonneborni]|uniref:Uncharacterized protein n=1 Tax=Paramecium sonneborni TaxID=65129 RepID=A0A8S1NXD8_9CILI|nr:unnamed protein product [Paramecium sonneborni]